MGYLIDSFAYETRVWCASVGIAFQAFWTLNENMLLLASKPMQDLARKYEVKPYILFIRWMLGVGVIPLTGTRAEANMKLELSARKLSLSVRDSQLIDEFLLGGERETGDTDAELETEVGKNPLAQV